MSHKKKGLLLTSGEWCQHLRKRLGLARVFWKAHRRAEIRQIREDELFYEEDQNDTYGDEEGCDF